LHKIKLWDAVGLGLIISYPTGIFVSNQTGGTACLQPFMEGFYLPVGNDKIIETNQLISPETDLSNYFKGEKYYGTGAINGIDADDAIMINEILYKYGLDDFIKVDIAKLKKSHEAWIYVTIDNNANIDLLSNFDHISEAILTWTNGD